MQRLNSETLTRAAELAKELELLTGLQVHLTNPTQDSTKTDPEEQEPAPAKVSRRNGVTKAGLLAFYAKVRKVCAQKHIPWNEAKRLVAKGDADKPKVFDKFASKMSRATKAYHRKLRSIMKVKGVSLKEAKALYRSQRDQHGAPLVTA